MKELTENEMKELAYSPLNIPTGRRGNVSIEHKVIKAGEKLTVVGLRNAIFYGVMSCEYVYPTDRIVHKILESGRMWMSDTPQENFMHRKAVQNAFGRVLVGGLGLGYYPALVAEKAGVTQVTIVEKNRNIISLIKPSIKNPKIKIIHADLFEYLRRAKGEPNFDSAYFDTWASTGELEWGESVVPLRRLVWAHFGEREIACWGEDEMHGQLAMGLSTHKLFAKKSKTPPDLSWNYTYNCFFKGLKKLRGNFNYALRIFLQQVGSPLWEQTFPWDKCVADAIKARNKRKVK